MNLFSMFSLNDLFSRFIMSTASDSLIPRKYQEVLLEKCKENNTILNLPTGSGKTYIAIMLINWFLKNNDLLVLCNIIIPVMQLQT